MRYISVCSGIEAATVAWHPLGWKPLALSEIEPFPRAVLAHHYPDVPCHGDFTTLRDEAFIVDADALVGGTPCQAFSVAGKRQSLADDRGNLTLEFVRLADAIDVHRRARGDEPCVIIWENVPGVLSVKDNAFGCLLAALVGSDAPLVPTGGKWSRAGLVAGPERKAAWRILDAQFFGLAQRRKRLFVVSSARDGFDPAAVLFEREGVQRNSAPSRETGQGFAADVAPRARGGGGLGTDAECDGALIAQPYPVAICLTQRMHKGINTTCDEGQTPVLAPITFGAQVSTPQTDVDLVQTLQAKNPTAVAFSCKDYGADAGADVAPTLRSMGHADSHANGGGQLAVAFDLRGREGGAQMEGPHDTANIRAASGGSSRSYVAASREVAQCLTSNYGKQVDNSDTAQGPNLAIHNMAVRRLTPRECERLQGFPDDYTLISVRGKPAADGPRYKALGNSMAVPLMRWIGERIQKELAR